MKDNLDYTTEIPHHEDESANLTVAITTYTDGPLMTVIDGRGGITVNRKELETLLAIMDRYDDAQKVMEGKQP